jgi:DNA-binding transcriptional regulator YiaG
MAQVRREGTAGEIRRLRRGAKLTQAAMAARLGVSLQTVSRWERGASDVSAVRMAGIRELLRPTRRAGAR